MKILFTVEFYEPHKGGAEEVVKQLAQRLVGFGHDVCVATTMIKERQEKIINGVKIEEFSISGKKVRHNIAASQEEIRRYQEFLQGDWDVVLNYAAENWASDFAFEVLDKIKAKKVFIPCGYTLKKQEYQWYYKQLPEFLQKYDALVYMSSSYQDKKFGDENGVGDKAAIIPNGAPSFIEKSKLGAPAVFDGGGASSMGFDNDLQLKKQLGIKTRHIVLTVANHYKAKGHGFTIKAFKRMNRKDTTLLIVGNIPGVGLRRLGHAVLGCYPRCRLSDILNKNIRLLSGRDRELIVSAYKVADLFLFGSSFEYAPLVMYESFAAKVLFICREVGMVRDHESSIKIIKTPEEMAKTANYYLDHRSERDRVIDLAYSEWQEKYDWVKIARRYEELFKKLVKS